MPGEQIDENIWSGEPYVGKKKDDILNQHMMYLLVEETMDTESSYKKH